MLSARNCYTVEMIEPAIAATQIVKTYARGRQKTEVIHGISLTVARGEFVAITGPSGSGKSTLLRILGLLDTPTSGVLEILGNKRARSDRALSKLRNRSIGFVFQDYQLIPHYSALANVMVPLKLAKLSHRSQRKRASEMLRLVGLSEHEHSRASELSGGQQQRVSIARALSLQPAILIADEPTGNLDSKTGQSILKVLRHIHKNLGTTIIMVTHSSEVAAEADRVIKLHDGHIVGGAS